MDSASTPSNVVDLAAYRARRNPEDPDEVSGRELFTKLRAEAEEFVAALVAGGAL